MDPMEALRKIKIIAHVCAVQRLPTDDKIIADHIEEIRDIATQAIAPTSQGEEHKG